MTVAASLARVIEDRIGGDLPVHLTAWDGSTAGPDRSSVRYTRSESR